MNEIEKAIETLKDMKGVFDTRSHKQYSLSALDLAISALEKQIPKVAKETQELMDIEYICPVCDMVNHYRHKYCWNCGQAIIHLGN